MHIGNGGLPEIEADEALGFCRLVDRVEGIVKGLAALALGVREGEACQALGFSQRVLSLGCLGHQRGNLDCDRGLAG